MIVDAVGVRPAADAGAVRDQIGAGRFFWLDLFAGDRSVRLLHLGQLGIEETDIAWALRFGQVGRMNIGRQKLRAVTWMAEPSGKLVEVHVICCRHCVMTVWSGDGAALDEIRQQFAERLGGFEQSVFHAAGILLQLLLGTVDHTARNLDLMLENMRLRLDSDASATNLATLSQCRQKLQSIVAGFSRYSSSVRSAIVGVEAVPGMDARGAAELNDYAEQVEDVEDQLGERRRWLSDMVHDYTTAIAQRQGEQINRLTLVSLIFLPVTALTGFFGMNFDWMQSRISGAEPFLVFGLLLPALCVLLTIAWLSHRGLLKLNLWPFAKAEPRPLISGTISTQLNIPGSEALSGFGVYERRPDSLTP